MCFISGKKRGWLLQISCNCRLYQIQIMKRRYCTTGTGRKQSAISTPNFCSHMNHQGTTLTAINASQTVCNKVYAYPYIIY